MSWVFCINEGTSRIVNLVQRELKRQIYMFKKGKHTEVC